MDDERDLQKLFCRFESSGDEADYGDSQVAARFVGVRKSEFSHDAFHQGITAYTLDIVAVDLRRKLFRYFPCRHAWASCSERWPRESGHLVK